MLISICIPCFTELTLLLLVLVSECYISAISFFHLMFQTYFSFAGVKIFQASPYFASVYHIELINDHHGSAGLLGSMAPCVLYGSNAERLGSAPGTFANHCLPYTGLYLIGQSFFGSNCVAPCFTYPSRTAIRRKFNLEVGRLFKNFTFLMMLYLKHILCLWWFGHKFFYVLWYVFLLSNCSASYLTLFLYLFFRIKEKIYFGKVEFAHCNLILAQAHNFWSFTSV